MHLQCSGYLCIQALSKANICQMSQIHLTLETLQNKIIYTCYQHYSYYNY